MHFNFLYFILFVFRIGIGIFAGYYLDTYVVDMNDTWFIYIFAIGYVFAIVEVLRDLTDSNEAPINLIMLVLFGWLLGLIMMVQSFIQIFYSKE